MTGTTPNDPEHSLRLALIEAQYALKNTADASNGRGVLVLVSGIELAGKGEAVMQLREWVDPRLLQVSAHLPRSQDWQRPFWQPYVRDLPEQGELVVLFGNWYGDLLSARMAGESQGIDQTEFVHQLEMLAEFEQYLKHEGVTVVKCWFDLSWKTLQKRLDKIEPSLRQWHKLHGLDWRDQAQYQQLQQLREHLGQDWLTIDCEEGDARNYAFAQAVLAGLQAKRVSPKRSGKHWKNSAIPPVLQSPDRQILQKEQYKAKRKDLQTEVTALLRQRGERPVVVVFEGMDAAGKGGAIRRLVAQLDPREYQIHTIAAPEPYELRHPYLWRFWRRLPDRGGLAIFDRSWYGRVLVERVEQLASPVDWQRAYTEINQFERSLTDAGAIVLKFWLSIDSDEQLLRFKAREQTPHKRFKLTDEDWRNRERWDEYVQAASDMLARTDHESAPWVVIATNDKYTARLAVLEALERQLRRCLMTNSDGAG
ncbi:MAG: phosphate--AMP phosphotransferase [Pseudomonadota bacterium]|nr:phosphate--AMP phosphotransferase [Pseudomonadota bacterium]